jgi:hypothetical protein
VPTVFGWQAGRDDGGEVQKRLGLGSGATEPLDVEGAFGTARVLAPPNSQNQANFRRNTGGRRSAGSETQIHRAVIEHLRLRGQPDCVFFHVPNGGYRRPVEARILRGLGVTKGVPDLLLFRGGRAYALELKSESGRPTPEQLAMLARLDAAGVFTAITHGLDRALRVLEAWGILRGSTA